MTGLSTRTSISFGWALVAGRNRVPSPAAGKTAVRTAGMSPIVTQVQSERARPGFVARAFRRRSRDVTEARCQPRYRAAIARGAGGGAAAPAARGRRAETRAERRRGG